MPTALIVHRPAAIIPMWHGSHQIPGPAGTDMVGTPNTPIGPRRVRLHHQGSGALVKEEWSDPVTGNVSMAYLAPGTYYMIAFDHTGQKAGVIETDIVTVPMEA